MDECFVHAKEKSARWIRKMDITQERWHRELGKGGVGVGRAREASKYD